MPLGQALMPVENFTRKAYFVASRGEITVSDITKLDEPRTLLEQADAEEPGTFFTDREITTDGDFIIASGSPDGTELLPLDLKTGEYRDLDILPRSCKWIPVPR